jgi:CRP/FNR family transcriptional regulator, cyclic AMP receptor protein
VKLQREAVISVLSKNHLFKSAGPAEIEMLADLCIQRTYKRDQYLFFQGDTADYFAVIAEGMVKVVLTSEQGNEIVLTTVEAPEMLGEVAAVDEETRGASAIAVRPTTVLIIKYAAFCELIQSSPELLQILLRTMASLVRRLTEQVSDLVFLDLGGRIAKLLLSLAERQGSEDNQTVTLDLGLTQTELANMVGGSRPAVNRVLQNFAARNLITVDGQLIVIHDFAGLRRRAGL